MMSVRARFLALAVLGGSSGLLPLVAQEPAASPHPNFSGSWELSAELSDDSRERLAEAERSVGPPSGPSYGRRGAGSGRAGAGGEPSAAPEGSRDSPRLLTIAHEEPQVAVRNATPERAFELILYTDGRQFEAAGPFGGLVETRATWQLGGRLAVDYGGKKDRRVLEVWELVADGSRILITSRIGSKGLLPAVEFQRIYDRIEIVPWDAD